MSFGLDSFGTVGFGEDRTLTKASCAPIAVSYGEEVFGAVGYGGFSIDNSINDLSVNAVETAGSTSAELVDYYPVPKANSFGTEAYGEAVFGGDLSYNFQMAASINEASATTSAIINTSSLGGVVTEPPPVTTASLANPALMQFSPVTHADLVLGSIAVSGVMTGFIVPPPPNVSSYTVTGNTASYSCNAQSPRVSGAIINTSSQNYNITEGVGQVSSLMLSERDSGFQLIETPAHIEAAFTSAPGFSVSVTESRPRIRAIFNDNNFTLLESQPSASASIKNGRVLVGTTQESRLKVQAVLETEQTIQGQIKQKADKPKSLFVAGHILNIAPQEPAISIDSRQTRGSLIKATVVEFPSVVSARLLVAGLITGSIIEGPHSVVSTIKNVRLIVLDDDQVTAISMNTENLAVTEYTHYHFIGLSEVGGKLYGIKEDGLYLLEGVDDEGTPIDSEFLTGESGMGQDRLKRIPMIHAQKEGNLEIILSVDGTAYLVPFSNRAKPGRGIRGNYIAFGARSLAGSQIKIDSITPTIEVLKKRGER